MTTSFLDNGRLRDFSVVHPFRNLLFLGIDYLSAGIILGGAIAFFLLRENLGFSWGWTVPVAFCAILLIGAVQHRIALMGHEASHFLLHPNRFANDLLAELFCFSPLFASLGQYRANHISHHRHPNDPAKDTNLSGARGKRIYSRFPLSKREFLVQFLLKFFWPPAVFATLLDFMRSAMTDTRSTSAPRRPLFRNATVLGVLYLALLIVPLHLSRQQFGLPFLLVVAPILWLAAATVCRLLPLSWFRHPGAKLAYSHRISGFVRISFYTLVFVSINVLEILTGAWIGGFVLLLWVVPLVWVFPQLMLIREVFQHANADQGEITNSRVIRVDPVTRWAILGYGNDIHIVHHIFPGIPHYHLEEAHEAMRESSTDYATTVEETEGTLHSRNPGGSILDHLAS